MPFIYTDQLASNLLLLSWLGWLFFELWVLSTRSGKGHLNLDQESKKLIICLVFIGTFLGYLAANYIPSFSISYFPEKIFWVGFIAFWFGIILRLWAIKTLGNYFKTVVLIQKNHKLIQKGPYTYIRHPSYTGAILTLMGYGLMLGNYLSLFCCVVLPLLGYLKRIQVEEQVLEQRFKQDFLEYKAKTKRLIPILW